MKNNKILLFGKFGQLGSYLYQELQDLNLQAYDYPEIDFNQPESIGQLIDQIKPGLIINAAAYTAVDQAEEEQSLAFNINGHTVGVIAEKARKNQAGLIHYSTDFVFDGSKGTDYTEEDETNPINVYGESKLLGEKKIIQAGGSYLIFRLSWVYSFNNPSFPTKVLNWARQYKTLRIVDDQISNPTWAMMVAQKTVEIVKQYQDNWFFEFEKLVGIYHLVGKGSVSRYDWAQAILDLDPDKGQQIAKRILPAKSSDFPTPANRPNYSALDCTKFLETFDLGLPDWKVSLANAMKKITSVN